MIWYERGMRGASNVGSCFVLKVVILKSRIASKVIFKRTLYQNRKQNKFLSHITIISHGTNHCNRMIVNQIFLFLKLIPCYRMVINSHNCLIIFSIFCIYSSRFLFFLICFTWSFLCAMFIIYLLISSVCFFFILNHRLWELTFEYF